MSDVEQKPHIMSSLTDKGYFALDLIAQGISPTHKELDQLWKDANQRGKSTNQPESDHLQQAPEMIGELRDKLDEAIPEDLPSNIREMAIEEIEQFFDAHLQAAVSEAEIKSYDEGYDAGKKATPAKLIDAVEFRREQYGWSAKKMAAMLDMNNTHYSEFIHGKRGLPIGSLRKAYAIGIPASILLADDIDRQLKQTSDTGERDENT